MHMTCPKCKGEWCWTCLALYQAGSPHCACPQIIYPHYGGGGW
jgi:hypothetical protein